MTNCIYEIIQDIEDSEIYERVSVLRLSYNEYNFETGAWSDIRSKPPGCPKCLSIEPYTEYESEYVHPTAPQDSEQAPQVASGDPINPDHYKFSNGVEAIDISENLTGNGAQALQYIARATRIDGHNKGNIREDLEKARWFIDRELNRIA